MEKLDSALANDFMLSLYINTSIQIFIITVLIIYNYLHYLQLFAIIHNYLQLFTIIYNYSFFVCSLAFLGTVKVKDLLIRLLSRDKADEIQLAAAKW